jgi:hypothetical protein
LTVATDGLDDVQVADARSALLPSLNTPVATNGCAKPIGKDALSGLIKTDDNVAVFTVRVVDADTEPQLAVIVDVPEVFAVANPVVLIVATLVADELHEIDADRS